MSEYLITIHSKRNTDMKTNKNLTFSAVLKISLVRLELCMRHFLNNSQQRKQIQNWHIQHPICLSVNSKVIKRCLRFFCPMKQSGHKMKNRNFTIPFDLTSPLFWSFGSACRLVLDFKPGLSISIMNVRAKR